MSVELQRPVLKPHLRAQMRAGEGIFLFSELDHKILRGRLHELVLPLIDGKPVDEICELLDGQASPSEIFFTLDKLQRAGLVDEAETSAGEDQGCELKLIGEADSALLAALSAAGVSVRAAARHTLVLTDHYLRAELAQVNHEARAPWLLAKISGRKIWLGPYFQPGQSACWECLRARLLANHPVVDFVQAKPHKSDLFSGSPLTPALRSFAAGLLASTLPRLAAGETDSLVDKIQIWDPGSGQVESHPLIRRPWCERCGHRTRREAAFPILLQGGEKSVARDGGFRTVTPQATLDRYQHLVSSLTGIVPELRRLDRDGDDDGMAVFVAGPNLARKAADLSEVRSNLRSRASGKGKTVAQAKAGALAEALERYSGNFWGDEPRRLASFRELGEAAIHPNACLLYSERQYQGREAWNARGSRFHFVPAPLEEETPIEWTPLWSLTRRETRYLPTTFCYFNAPRPGHPPFCLGCSNGNAAGNTLEEAILQGFLELVERDAVALWWYNRLRRPAVDIASFGDPALEAMQRSLAAQGRDLWALDLTSDLGIPVFVALSKNLRGPKDQIMLGLGAHLDARVALGRAASELKQMLSLMKVSNDNAGAKVEESVKWFETATLASEPYLVPLTEAPHPAAFYPVPPERSLADNVRWCEELVRARGMEMLVLEQTRADVGLPVAKVVVPGLRHFWARFAPGRLYDVPVAMGWLERPKREDELNPIPFFL